MGLFDKVSKLADEKGVKDALNSTGDSLKKAYKDTVDSVKAHNEESKDLKKPLEGAIARYEFTYVSGLESVAKAKAGAWGMNVMEDRFAFRVTMTTKDWLQNLDIMYDDIQDVRIEKRTILTTEVLLGGGNNANQQQENVFVIDYTGEDGRFETLRVEMLTGVTIYNQAAKCIELMDLLKRENILPKLKKSDNAGAAPTPAADPLEQIEKLSKLKDAGVITEEEFNAKKSEILEKI